MIVLLTTNVLHQAGDMTATSVWLLLALRTAPHLPAHNNVSSFQDIGS